MIRFYKKEIATKRFILKLILLLLFLHGCSEQTSNQTPSKEPNFILTVNSKTSHEKSLEELFLTWTKFNQYVLVKGGTNSALPANSFTYFVYSNDELVFAIHSIKIKIAAEIFVYSSKVELLTHIQTWLTEEGFVVNVRKVEPKQMPKETYKF